MLKYFWPSDDEQLAGQAVASYFDEDGGWWASVQQCGASLALAAALTLGVATTQAAQGVFSQNQDDPAGHLSSQNAIDETYWQNPVAPVNWPQPSVFTSEDTEVQFVSSFTPDDTFWQPLLAPAPATNYVSLPFVEFDNLPSEVAAVPVVDESDSPLATPWEPQWTLLFFLDDGSTVPVYQPDEDFWQNPVPPQNWPQPSQPFAATDDDGLVPQFPTDEDYSEWLVPPVADSLRLQQQFVFEQNEPGNLIAFTNEDYWQNPVPPVADSLYVLPQSNFEQTDATGGLFSQLEEGLWQNPTAPVVASNYQQLPYWFDQGEIFTFVPFTDEVYWQNPTAPVPDSIWLLRQDAFDNQEPAGSLYLDLDEGLWVNLVSPVPDGLRLLQPFTFEQHDATGGLRNTVDEDFWNNPVAPVVWPQTTVFTDDGLQGFTPNTGQDEDFWSLFQEPWVAPVAPTNFLRFPYSPDPEEIPAGSLVPPIPPPPFVCPGPPLGPDKDTIYNYFVSGNGSPIEALYCLTCGSNKPLLVRGDYALWCNTCCAFVSKQQTTMNTVKAPGQFNSIF